jgi:hypothetical protein
MAAMADRPSGHPKGRRSTADGNINIFHFLDERTGFWWAMAAPAADVPAVAQRVDQVDSETARAAIVG